MFRWYYIAPVNFIAVLYLAKTITANLTTAENNWLISLLLSAIIISNLLQPSAYATLVRKKDIDFRLKPAEFIEEYPRYKEGTSLFLPAKMNPGAPG